MYTQQNAHSPFPHAPTQSCLQSADRRRGSQHPRKKSISTLDRGAGVVYVGTTNAYHYKCVHIVTARRLCVSRFFPCRLLALTWRTIARPSAAYGTPYSIRSRPDQSTCPTQYGCNRDCAHCAQAGWHLRFEASCVRCVA